MVLTVHHLQVSQSERVPWLCEELDIPYKLVIYQRDPFFSPPELKALTTMGAAPVIEDAASPFSESSPLVLSESAAVVEYIVHKYGNGRLMLSPTHKEYANYLYWFHFSNGNLQPAVSTLMNLARAVAADHPARSRMETKLKTILKMMDDRLAKGAYLAGAEFTAADIMSMFTLTTMRKFFPYSLGDNSNVVAWLQRCAARPGFKKARAKCDPDWAPAIEAEAPAAFEPTKKESKA